MVFKIFMDLRQETSPLNKLAESVVNIHEPKLVQAEDALKELT